MEGRWKVGPVALRSDIRSNLEARKLQSSTVSSCVGDGHMAVIPRCAGAIRCCRSEGRNGRRFKVSDSPLSCKRCSVLFCDEFCLAVHLIRCPRTAKRRWQRLWSNLPAIMERWLLWCAGLFTALMACFNCGRQA